jgi:hypothetical protein
MNFYQALSIFESEYPLKKSHLKHEYQRLAQQYNPRNYHTYQEQIWASKHLLKLHQAYHFLLQNPWKESIPAIKPDKCQSREKTWNRWAKEPSTTSSSLFQLGAFSYEKLMIFLCGTPNCSGIVGFLLMGVVALVAIMWLPYIYLAFLFVYLIIVYIKIQRIFLNIGSWIMGQDLRPSVPTASGQLAYLSIITLVALPLLYVAYYLMIPYPFSIEVWKQSFSNVEQLILLGGAVVFLITFYEWLSGMYAMWLRLRLRYVLSKHRA